MPVGVGEEVDLPGLERWFFCEHHTVRWEHNAAKKNPLKDEGQEIIRIILYYTLELMGWNHSCRCMSCSLDKAQDWPGGVV